MRVTWIAAIAAGALLAGSQSSPAQYPEPYPPAYSPPIYTERQLIPDHPPVHGYKPVFPWTGQSYDPRLEMGAAGPAGGRPEGCSPYGPGSGPGYGPAAGPGFDTGAYTGYANPSEIFTGCYIAGMAGGIYLEDQFSEAVNSNVLRQVDAAFDWSIVGGGAIGYRMPTRPHDLGQLRFEADTLYHQNSVKRLIFNGTERNAKGHVSANSFMFNMVLDFIHCKHEAITPYIGGGVGIVRVDQHLLHNTSRFVDSDIVFGFQGMAGISVQLWENLEWFTEWRYLGGSNPKFNREDSNSNPSLVELRSEYNTHTVMSGLRLNLR